MKKLIQLGLLAALAGGSVHATAVNFVTGTATGPVPTYSPTASGVTATGYFYNEDGFNGSLGWRQANVRANGSGVGVVAINTSDYPVTGTFNEYILLDFGGTATGYVQVDSIVLNFATTPTGTPPQYFTYQWLSSAPSVGVQGNPSVPLTAWTTAPASGTIPGDLTFNSIPASARYLLLGATNHAGTANSAFQVVSLQYTSVPDGAHTLALMGAALATLGLAARRRKQ